MDLANLKLPEVERPDFSDDLTGQIAEYLFDHADAASSDRRMHRMFRRTSRDIREARQKTHRAWARAISKLRADQNMVSILEGEGLLEPLNKIIKCISQDYEPMPDKGGSLPTVPLTMARMAADKFFPDRFGMVEAATINAALQQAGFITEDMTDTIRTTVLKERPARDDATMTGETEKQRDARCLLHDLRHYGCDLHDDGELKVSGSLRNDPGVLQVVARLEDELRALL